jgi:hypothetical protein
MMRWCCAVVLALLSCAHAFMAPANLPLQQSVRRASSLQMGFGDAFKKAFANEETGPKQNAGLKNGPAYVDVMIDGKKVQAVAGQRLSQVHVCNYTNT